MQRLGIVNMFIGFMILLFAASAGSFIANDITIKFLRENSLVDDWMSLMLKSAHGHTNLFGMIHISLGLTMPYSDLPRKIKVLQTIGLGLGSFAMSFLMFIKAFYPPKESFDLLGIFIGCCLSAALIAIGAQAYGLLSKLIKKSI